MGQVGSRSRRSSKTREPQEATAALLPAEVLERIFLLTYPEVEVFHDGRRNCPSTWSLAYVCSSWRRAARGYQVLWTNLWFDDQWIRDWQGDFTSKTLRDAGVRTRLALSLSGSRPLSVRMSDNDRFDHHGLEKDERALNALYLPIFTEAHRLVSYAGNTRLLKVLVLKGYTQFPQLLSLAVDNRLNPLSKDSALKTPIHVPSLQELTLFGSHFTPSPYGIFSEFPWGGITRLTLRQILLGDVDDFAAIFIYCPKLEHLTIDEGRISNLPTLPPKRTHLAPTLRSLTIMKCAPGVLLLLVLAIKAPRLASLHLNEERYPLEIGDVPEWDVLEWDRPEWDTPERDRPESPDRPKLSYFEALYALFKSLDDRMSLKTFMFYGAPDVQRSPHLRLAEMVNYLQGLQTLVLDDITPDLAEYLKWDSGDSSGNPHLDHPPLPDLQSLICMDSDTKNEERDALISSALHSRKRFRYPSRGMLSVL